MKTQKINLINVDFSGFSATEADRRDGAVGHVNYALSQIDLATGIDTDYNARGRVLFNILGQASNNDGINSGSSLVIGQKYIIDYLEEGDDFTNVGAAENAVGVVFTATGETPDVWNGSVLHENLSKDISDIVRKYSDAEFYKWVFLADSALASFNKGFEYIGGPSVLTGDDMFDYISVDPELVTENVEYYYGNITLLNMDTRIYDSTFPVLNFSTYTDLEMDQSFLVLEGVDFRNYTVWSSPLAGVYRSLDAGSAYLSEFVNSEDGKIYIPVVDTKIGLRFDFEIRLYDYVAPVPVVDVDR